MPLLRRDFLKKAGLATVAGAVPWSLSCTGETAAPPIDREDVSGTDSWEDIRQHFLLDPQYIHLAGLLVASHPALVRKSIAKHRRALDENPADYVQDNDFASQVRQAAAAYMKVKRNEIALTDSTTMGTALLINGLHIRQDQEMLTADYDYYSTHRSIAFKAHRSGASFRKVPIYKDVHRATQDEILDKLTGEIRPNTRLVTGTWVHSATGLKIPVRKIADRVAEINADRSEGDRVLFFVDGVHGFGVENTAISELGCDFFSAGTHKWLLAPRGTGILWGHSRAQDHISPTIPTFTNGAGWGGKMTPGGYKAFEHQWAMAGAFEFHREIGKARVQERIHGLARQLKEGLSQMKHIKLYTPMDQKLSAGIVCFDVDGMDPEQVVSRLADKNIIASTTPYRPSYPRFSPGIFNTTEEMEEVLRAVRGLV